MTHYETGPQGRLRRGCAKFERALRRGESHVRKDGDVKRQAAGFRRDAERRASMLALVRQVLCSKGVMPVRFGEYIGYALHVDKLKRTCGPETLSLMVAAATEQWLRRDARLDVLLDIGRNVFDIDVSGAGRGLAAGQD